LRPPEGGETPLMSPSVDLSPVVEIAVITAHKSLPPVVAAVTVDFDKSVLIQMALFSILIVLLKPLLLDPMLRVFSLREERTEGAKGEARSMQERAADILSKYEGEVAKVRAEATTQRDTLRKETAQLEAQILADARKSAESIVTDGRAQMTETIAALETDLEKMSRDLAKNIAGQVIGREINS
jgi:F-type H+-transporting ATPase subunit b